MAVFINHFKTEKKSTVDGSSSAFGEQSVRREEEREA